MKISIALALTVDCLGSASAQAATPRSHYWATREATARTGKDGCMGGPVHLNTTPRRYKSFMCVEQKTVIETLWYVVCPMDVTGPRTYKFWTCSRTSPENYLNILSKSRRG
jgi:hypothetical protein